MNGRVGVASVTAIVTWTALGLQFSLIVDHMTAGGASAGQAIWRFFGFFTILTNCAVAIVATAMAFRAKRALGDPRVRLATVTAIAMVGIVYSIALRSIWNPEGWQAVADHALHDATPLLFLLSWILADHGSLRWRDIVWAVVPPALYCAYAFARGALEGWYAYWFLDPRALGGGQMATNIGLLLAAFSFVGLAFIAADRWLSQRR
ncbi:Pr6Pr family membrane protein [Mesorhizobium retamae]|uniref:Pr6Pr family membrane protein n=1 Tax=Mesorhizobium retamae TaxID=2912854 RepID=A0ABS9QMG7_9HYPH|nr:Pr6Pr family membrane protein [Mesorhizobium sp. IRAMC:0171]MCG7508630.1 Pr6Pr family membrane protein [Mesorhizobium sp. IRAMC:0171]